MSIVILLCLMCWTGQEQVLLRRVFLLVIGARFCKPFKEPRNRSQPVGPVRQLNLWYKNSICRTRHQLHWLAESSPQNRFLGSLNVYKYGLRIWAVKKAEFIVQTWDSIISVVEVWAPSQSYCLKKWIYKFSTLFKYTVRSGCPDQTSARKLQ